MAKSLMKPLVAFVLGGPGSGKGTQCKSVCEEFGFHHLSAGDLLRAERNKPGSQYGNMIEQHIREGRIVPVEVTCSLIEKAMTDHTNKLNKNTRGKFLIDGFPRNEDNLTGWQRQIGDKAEIAFVLFLDCPDDVCIKRCLVRGEQGSNRSDDNETSLRKRLVTYREDTMPIINQYESMGLLRRVNGDQSAEKVYADVRKLFAQIN